MRLAPTLAFLVLAVPLLAATPALADGYGPVPPLDGEEQNLRIRFVKYDGSTNGQMVVELKNTGKKTETFVAEGLYFVPEGDPEKAPQRLGAAGPLVVVEGKRKTRRTNGVALAPGERKRVRLEVFCIDSHRSSPTPKTSFSLATRRLPEKLRRKIDAGNQRILRKNAGDVKKSKAAIQSHMWETRNADWVELQGERKNEKSAPPPRQRIQQREPIREQRRRR